MSIKQSARLICTAALAVLMFAAYVAPASAQFTDPEQIEPGPEADLSLDLDAPDETPLVGDSIDLTLELANDGPEDAEDVFVYGYLSDSFDITDPPDDCTVDEWGGFACDVGDLDEDDELSFSLSAERVRARESWASFSVSSSNYDPTYGDNYAELYFEPDTSEPADVGVTIDGPNDPEVDEEFTYEIEVENDGPEAARDVRLTDSMPPGVDYQSWSSSDPSDECELWEQEPYVEDSSDVSAPSYIYRELRCQLGTLEPNEEATLEVVVEREDPFELWNSVWVSTASYDANYENDFATASTSADESVTSDLFVSVDGPSTTPLVGDRFELAFTVGNDGPAPLREASMFAVLPDGLVFESATSEAEDVSCSSNDFGGGGGVAEGGGADDGVSDEPASPEPASTDPAPQGGKDADRVGSPIYYGGGGFNCALGTVAEGDSISVIASVSRTKAREIWVTGTSWAYNFDPDYMNNYDELSLAPDTSEPADVGITLNGPEDAEVGEEVEFTIEATNEGPMTARSVVVYDNLPFGLDFVSATSSDGSDTCSYTDEAPYFESGVMSDMPYYVGYRRVTCELGSMTAGESTTISLKTQRSTEFEIWNTAYVESSSYDADYENDWVSARIDGETGIICPLDKAGTAEADQIASFDCPVEAKAGDDNIAVQVNSTTKNVDVSAGSGSDVVTVNVPSSSGHSRRIEVNTGSGADSINISVAPGATNAIVLVRAGAGNDTITVDASGLRQGLVIHVWGGKGADTMSPVDPLAGIGEWPTGFRLHGGPGHDSLVGGYADDQLWGGPGKDMLDGSSGDDTLDGGPGKDGCVGGPGRDTTKSC